MNNISHISINFSEIVRKFGTGWYYTYPLDDIRKFMFFVSDSVYHDANLDKWDKSTINSRGVDQDDMPFNKL